jgi:hypothetical protein
VPVVALAAGTLDTIRDQVAPPSPLKSMSNACVAV